ncbi:hypothetical protein KSF_001860 [Reticulibacter mediterranei]|uniref:Uncharacterized protein n=1 Tax=Reticulibacter mediterranei TaxID=2778369 RepID=A0A8J3IAQ6_9CHLR|nr:M36 family metallopeptidase [Reticulibacter mediterranei]GHO90138.1 hypothetical protein KSF_001860 [Reticulibacter mediterranei]
MSYGRVYTWTLSPDKASGGYVTATIVHLPHLDQEEQGREHLRGRYVHVRNAGALNELDSATGQVRAVALGDALPDEQGNFLFEPGRGGHRMDQVGQVLPEARWRFIQASHFGEVNTYFHLDAIAAYVDGLLDDLGRPSLPRVVAVVNAHHAATAVHGTYDGVQRGERWVPFQGGHYRLPGRSIETNEYEPISLSGEIHLGPGRQLLKQGTLVEAAGGNYRANASHNAGILYHEYGHHITQHTADFQRNARRPPDQQNNHKVAIDEGTGDYWAATWLGTPHIWAWHHPHDAQVVHARSLTSEKTMVDYDSRPGADAHANGTIWAAALWDLRTQIAASEPDGVRRTDLLVLKALLLSNASNNKLPGMPRHNYRKREGFAAGLTALLQADARLYAGCHRDLVLTIFARRGIHPACLYETE